MKHFRLFLVVFAAALGLARAQEEQSRQPPTEIPDFSNLDEYVYESKNTLVIGVRRLSGAKAQFSGSGKLAAPEAPNDATTANLLRQYHDGGVLPDARTAPRYDVGGNPIIDPSSGAQYADPIAPDGKTNTWLFANDKQVTADGYLAFHQYSAVINDPTIRHERSTDATGVDLAVLHDMGKLFGGRASWGLIAGVSIGDLAAKRDARVQATLTTLTDLYSLDGQVLPAAPYSAPSSSSTPVVDASGSAVLTADGSGQVATTDTTVLLNNRPIDRTTQSAVDSTSVSNRWKLRGAYFTFRGGPSISMPFTSRLRATVSAGAAVIYSGTTYSVEQSFQPATGLEITDSASNMLNKVLPGYFADASLQFDLTERAGFFAGAVYQSAGSYTQTLNTEAAKYSTKIDFANQNGLRAGMTIRF